MRRIKKTLIMLTLSASLCSVCGQAAFAENLSKDSGLLNKKESFNDTIVIDPGDGGGEKPKITYKIKRYDTKWVDTSGVRSRNVTKPGEKYEQETTARSEAAAKIAVGASADAFVYTIETNVEVSGSDLLQTRYLVRWEDPTYTYIEFFVRIKQVYKLKKVGYLTGTNTPSGDVIYLDETEPTGETDVRIVDEKHQ